MSDYNDSSINDLKILLKQRGLPVTGTKTVLIGRLVQYDEENAPVEEPPVRKSAAKKPPVAKAAPKKATPKKATSKKEPEPEEEIETEEPEVPKPSREKISREKVSWKPPAKKTTSKKAPVQEDEPEEPAPKKPSAPKRTPRASVPEEPPKKASAKKAVPKQEESFFDEPIPEDCVNTEYDIPAPVLMEAIRHSKGSPAILFEKLASYSKNQDPQWNEVVSAYVDRDGNVFDANREFVIGKLHGKNIRPLTASERKTLVQKRFVVAPEESREPSPARDIPKRSPAPKRESAPKREPDRVEEVSEDGSEGVAIDQTKGFIEKSLEFSTEILPPQIRSQAEINRERLDNLFKAAAKFKMESLAKKFIIAKLDVEGWGTITHQDFEEAFRQHRS